MWLDEVLIPWEHVFLTEMSPEPVAAWLFWHQLYCWLAKAEFTLGLALACADALALKEHEGTIDYLVDLMADVQTVRTCQTAAELDPERSVDGFLIPNRLHVAAGSLAMLKARQRMARSCASSPVVAGRGARGHGSHVVRGRRWSGGIVRRRRLHRTPALGAAAAGLRPRDLVTRRRESAFELHANGGIPAWRGRLRRFFADYNTWRTASSARCNH
jgi:4-hydroxyphenylacetate 3-monooxygenase